MNASAVELIRQINTKLPDQLGVRYQIIPQYSTASVLGNTIASGCELHPDIVVLDRETRKITMVEVKGSAPNDDLPLATLPFMRRMKAANELLNPDMVLVSVSRVPEPLEKRLENDGVHVIEWTEHKDVVDGVAGWIRSSSARG